MRPVLPGDLTAASRALLAVAPRRRARFAVRMIRQAEIADRHRIETGRAHWLYGNGTLMAAAMRHLLLPEPWLDDPDYLDCQMTVLAALGVRNEQMRARSGPGSRAATRGRGCH